MTDSTQTDAAVLTVADNEAKHRFEIAADGALAAFTTYRIDPPGTYAFTHTQTLPPFAGQGIASALIADVLDRMRAGGFAVLPYCPFVNRYLRSHPDQADLVPVAELQRFGVSP